MLESLATVLAGLALAAPSPQARVLVAGPALAGDRVVWGEVEQGRSVLRAWPDATPLWESASSWFAGPLAGSPTLIAFSRSYDGCPDQPGVACPVETQTLAGRPRGSLHPLATAERCSAGGPNRRLAVSGSLVALLQLRCGSAGPSLSVHERTRTIFRRPGAACCDLALAGRYLAWRSGASVQVDDLRTGRLVYRVAPAPRELIAAFDIQADGTLALVLGPGPNGRTTLAWRLPASEAMHRLALDVTVPPQGPAIRIAGDRILFEAHSRLLVADLRGHLRVLAGFSTPVERVGSIDASGERVTWASQRITSSRVDCPPPGQERPCRLLKSGIETIWLAGLTAGRPRPIVRWAFTDSP